MKQNDLIFPCTFVFAQKTSLTGQLLLLLFPCFVSKYGIFSQIKLECVQFTSYTMLELSAASYHTCIFPCHNSPDSRSSLLLSVISNCATLKSVLLITTTYGYSHSRLSTTSSTLRRSGSFHLRQRNCALIIGSSMHVNVLRYCILG